MAKPTLLAGLLLLGLTLIFADGTTNGRCDYASFFLIDVSIQPGNDNFTCDGPKAQIKLNNLLQRISDRQFEKYFDETLYLANMTMEGGDLCQGTNGVTNRPALQGTNHEDRRDLARLGVGGFLYTTSSQCRFCLGDNRDTGGEWIELGDDENTTSSGRSSSDWNDWGWKYVRTPADVDSQLQGTLQRRLTRVLTRKVNRNVRSSCLVGSESTVTVNLTAVGNHRPWVATCPQEIPADRETGGMGIDRDQP